MTNSLPDAALVIVNSPAGGEEVANGFTVRGCSRTFESNVQWRLLDREGEELASGFAMGGGVDGPAPFVFDVEYEVAERQIAHLEVFEEDASEGEGFPPPRAVVPLVIAATGVICSRSAVAVVFERPSRLNHACALGGLQAPLFLPVALLGERSQHFHELDDVQSMTRASIVVPKVSATRVSAVTEPGLRPCSISER